MHDSLGTKNQPQYADTGGSDDAADLSEIANYAAKVGNRKADASSVRTALTGSDLWDGLEFFETDTGRTYLYWSGWVLLFQTPVPWASITLATGWAPQGVPPYAPLRSRLDQNANTHIQGQILPKAGYAATDVFGTLPSGQRPAVRLEVPVVSNSTSARGIGGVIIDTNGNMSLNPAGIGAFDFGETIISTI